MSKSTNQWENVLGVNACLLDLLTVDEIADLMLKLKSTQLIKNEKIRRERQRIIRSLLKPGSMVLGDVDMIYGRYRKHLMVKELKGTVLYYMWLNQDGTVCKMRYRLHNRGQYRVRTVHTYDICLGHFYERVTSIRHRGKLMYRRADFLRKQKATTLKTTP